MEVINKNFDAIPEVAFTKSDDLEFNNVKVLLNIVYKEIPKTPTHITMPIPYNPNKNSMCIVIKDLDKDTEVSVKKFQKLLTKDSVKTSDIRILPLKELTLMQFEEKRKLAASYKVFLVDKRIAHRAMNKFGKWVLKSNNHPIPVDFDKGIAEAIKFGQTHVRFVLKAKGPTESIEIGNLTMTRQLIKDNFTKMVESIIAKWPGKIDNIRSIYFKGNGPTYPVYHDAE